MENASKFLLIAGGLLIGVMVLALLYNLYQHGGNVVSSTDTQKAKQAMAIYNKPFTSLQSVTDKDDKAVLTMYDVVSAINYAKSINIELDDPDNSLDRIRVYIENFKKGGFAIVQNNDDLAYEGKDETKKYSQDKFNVWIKNYADDYRFEVKEITYNSEGKVVKITFRKI